MNIKKPLTTLYFGIERRLANAFKGVVMTLSGIGRGGRRQTDVPNPEGAASIGSVTIPTASIIPLEVGQKIAVVEAIAEPDQTLNGPGGTETPAVQAAEIVDPHEIVGTPDHCEFQEPNTVAAALVAVPDPELEALRTRAEWMEKRIFDLETRKTEMDRLIDEHAYCQYQALGELLDEHLRLQQEVLRLRAERSLSEEDRRAAEVAAEEYAAYRKAAEELTVPPLDLGDDEQSELKALYRAAAMRCHPDRVDEAEKARAHEMFLRTQEAYRKRDLEALRMICRQLGADKELSRPADHGSAATRLKVLLDAMEDKGVELAMAIQALQAEGKYRMARQKEKWADHFESMRRQLANDCAALRTEIARF